jgi:hypothetical protein
MQQAMEQLGREIGRQASIDLAGRSFGALAELELVRVQAVGSGEAQHWELAWEADCAGVSRTLTLVVLPEFLELEPELLVSQLAVMLADRALAEFED